MLTTSTETAANRHMRMESSKGVSLLLSSGLRQSEVNWFRRAEGPAELPEPDEPRHAGVDRLFEQMLDVAPKPGGTRSAMRAALDPAFRPRCTMGEVRRVPNDGANSEPSRGDGPKLSPRPPTSWRRGAASPFLPLARLRAAADPSTNSPSAIQKAAAGVYAHARVRRHF